VLEIDVPKRRTNRPSNHEHEGGDHARAHGPAVRPRMNRRR
jgi:hypothetical protein